MTTAARLRFTKLGKVRFTSHRDVARIFERALRRAAVPVAYSQGFSPRPRLSFGLALSTGHESRAEYLDVVLSEGSDVGVDALPERLSEVLPTGIDVTAATLVDSTGDSLQKAVTSCSWEIVVPDTDLPTATGLVADVLAAESIIVTRERKGREITDDLRPYVRSIDVNRPAPTGVVLTAVLGTQPRGLRPAELLAAIDVTPQDCHVLRTHQWIERDGARTEPLPLGARPARPAEVRTS